MSMVGTVRAANGINMLLSSCICTIVQSLLPVCVEKMPCPYGPSNLTV